MNRWGISLKLAPLMPDEHIFSGLIRSCLLSGFKDLDYGLKSINVKPTYRLKADSLFNDEFAKVIQQYCQCASYEPLYLLKQHSLYNIFSVGSPFRFNKDINNTLKLGKSPYQGVWKQRYDVTYSKDWKFCALCIKADIVKYGFSYWHCSHQIPTVSTCTIHHTALCIAVNQKNQNLVNLNECLLPQEIIHYSSQMIAENSSMWDDWLVTMFNSLKGKKHLYAQEAKSAIFSYLDLPKKNLLPEDVEFRHLQFEQDLLVPKLLPYELLLVENNKSKKVLVIIEKLYGFEVLAKIFKQYSPKGRIIQKGFKDITREPLTNIKQRIDHPIPFLLLLFAINLCPETLRIKYE
jgi:hypothetical protein